MADLFCMLCGEVPCTCVKPRGRRRAGTRPAPTTRSQPDPVQQTVPADSKPRTARVRAVQASEPVEVMARDVRRSDVDEVEDFQLIEAVRALAHMVDPRDLSAFKDHLSPSDYLSPPERRADWLKRVHRGVSDGESA